MPNAIDNIIMGTFTSDGNSKNLSIRSDVDYIEVINYTQMATTQATGRVVRSEWFRGFAADSAILYTKTNSTNALNGSVVTSGGFTLLDTSVTSLGTALPATAITNANPAVVSMASTAGLSVGDTVRVTNSTGMLQIAGIAFTITAITPNTNITLGYLNASGFAAPATAATIQKINNGAFYYPTRHTITGITAANPCVITLGSTVGLTVGQRITINVPQGFGMTQLNGQRVVITAVNTTTNAITVSFDTSTYTAFAYPASASVPFTMPHIVPFGDAPPTAGNPLALQSVLDGATYNTAILGIKLAAGAQAPAGSSGDVIYWKALKSFQYQGINPLNY